MKPAIGWNRVAATALGLVLLASVAPLTAQEEAGDLTVQEYGVGTAVVDRLLKGKADSFPEGTRVYFWTRVVGGSDGDRIRHVWIHDGKEVSIGLNIGGSHWRTYTNKMLYPGSAGEWVVEARGAAGAVLARKVFTCTAPAATDDGSDANAEGL